MLNYKKNNLLRALNILAAISLIYLIFQNILSFFNQNEYRYLHIDERLVVMNPIINVYNSIDVFDRFTHISPILLKNIITITAEMVLGGTLDYGRIYNNIFILFVGPLNFFDTKLVIFSGRIIQMVILIYSVYIFSNYFIKKDLKIIFILLSLGLPGAYYIVQNPKPDSLAILLFALGLKQIFIIGNLRKGFFFVGISVGTKIITLIPGVILGLYLIYPLKKINSLKKILDSIISTYFGVLIAQPALLIPLPRIYKKIFNAVSESSSYNQNEFLSLDYEFYKAWINKLAIEHRVPNIWFTILLIITIFLIIRNFYLKINILENYFLLSSFILIIFITFNVERTWNYYLFIPFLFLLIYIFKIQNYEKITILFGFLIISITFGGLLLHNDKAVNSFFNVDVEKNISLDLAIEYIDNKYLINDYVYKKVYWDSDYYFPGRNIDYFSDFIVIENWEREKQIEPLYEKVDFIVTTNLFKINNDVKLSKFGELYVYEK